MQQATLPFGVQNNLTPMMKQYLNIKAEHPDAILFYRMGDFYEMFFEDATIAAPILAITLTKRGQHQNQDIPMCGVPFHSSDNYIAKLIEAGYKVAICEQLETPEEAKKRGAKSVVKREVVRIITPGTITEDNLLKNASSNFLLAIAAHKEQISVAWADISTGEFYVSKACEKSLTDDLARIAAKEILISDRLYRQENICSLLSDYRRIVTIQANNLFELSKAEHKFQQYYNVISSEVFGLYSQAELIACGALLEYIELTQKTSGLKISSPSRLNNALFMSIDNATRNNLELTRTMLGEKKGSLLSLIDKTKTSSGTRLLANYLAAPLVDVEAINNRLDLVEFFLKETQLRSDQSVLLKQIGDIERAISRLGFNRGGPRDLEIICCSLKSSDQILANFLYLETNAPVILEKHLSNLSGFDELFTELNSALATDLPMLARDGGFIKKCYSPRLDHLNDLKENSQQRLNELRHKYIKETGITSLKINYNNVLGYFIDITPQHASKMGEQFIHRQTLANSVRYTSMELRELESELLNLADNIIKTELTLYQELVAKILEKSEALLLFSYSIAVIDVAISLADLAEDNNYCRPVLDNSVDFDIQNGRHPVIEISLNQQKQEFIANDCHLNPGKNLWLITGPNMAGKSTYLRQNALIAIMAQIGSFVPAKSAHIGIVDKIYSRVGAADDLARGRSTFMVEMVETANILNNATNASLIILDEIGRGTSTYDGVSIASSCLEYIHNNLKCRALFATHYHELTNLQNQLASLVCYTMQIKEWQDKVIFMHKIIEGVADKSYGIHVAELAGLPKVVIARAKTILTSLEQAKDRSIDIDISSNIKAQEEHPIAKFIEELDIDNLSPKEALEILYKMKYN